MDEILALPAGPLARAALDLAQQTESSLVADHSIRSFLFARLLAGQDGSVGDAAYDENLLFAACTMHDLGLGTSARAMAVGTGEPFRGYAAAMTAPRYRADGT